MKKCAKCKDIKEESLFHRRRSRKDGLSPYCKDCVQAAYMLKNPKRRAPKKIICKRCEQGERVPHSSYCYECRKAVGRENYHKRWDGIPNSPQHLYENLTGKKFGRLLVITELGKNGRGQTIWKCLCDCGEFTETITATLKSGNTQSCGCLQKERAKASATRHGMKGSAEYGIWHTMRRRCTDPKVKNYHHYGGRGISVCDRWLSSFENFYADMGPRPTELHSIERVDTNGNYCPENCIWGTEEIQSRNRRNNVKITINGVTKLMMDWAKDYGVTETLVRSRRAAGWSLDETIFTTPKFTKKNKNICKN